MSRNRPNENPIGEEVGQKPQHKFGHLVGQFWRRQARIIRIEMAMRVLSDEDGGFIPIIQNMNIAHSGMGCRKDGNRLRRGTHSERLFRESLSQCWQQDISDIHVATVRPTYRRSAAAASGKPRACRWQRASPW